MIIYKINADHLPPSKGDTLSLSPDVDKSITMFFDKECVLCVSEAKNLHALNPEGIKLIPVEQGLHTLNEAGFSRTEALTYLCVQDSCGNWYTHMDAIRLLHKTAGKPWASLLYLPLIKQLGDAAYPIVARNRYRMPDWLISIFYGKKAVVNCRKGVCKLALKDRVSTKV